MNQEAEHNAKHLKQFRKELRNNSTPAEITLWQHLKNKQLEGYKFRRQHSVGNYILDFYCHNGKLAIELDGADHYTIQGAENDQNRDDYLREQDIRVLRFENKLIFENMEGVLDTILDTLKAS